MKKAGLILSLSMILILLQASVCFAGTLKIDKTYPKDGTGGYQPLNMCVTLYFNQDVALEKNQSANNKCFKIVDEKGKAQDITVLYHPEETGKVMVLLKNPLKENSSYKFTVAKGFQSSEGELLPATHVVDFKTRDTSNDTKVYMVLTLIMFGGMMFFTMKSAKKQAEKEEVAKKGSEKVNPYKVAKETGKPVEEIVEKDQRRKAKEQQKRQKDSSRRAGGASKDQDTGKIDDGNYRVKGKKPISAGGSTYITGRKAKAQAEAAKKAAARAAGTTNPKGRGSKKGGKKR